jgi:hypothetical protein
LKNLIFKVTDIPAICGRCNTLFIAKNIIHLSGNSQIKITNCETGPCPKCGGSARIIDGIYKAIDEIIDKFATSESNENQVLLSEIKSLKESGKTDLESLDLVCKNNSWLSKTLSILPKDRNEKIAWASIIVSAILGLYPIIFSSSLSKKDIKDAVYDAIKESCSNQIVCNHDFGDGQSPKTKKSKAKGFGEKSKPKSVR